MGQRFLAANMYVSYGYSGTWIKGGCARQWMDDLGMNRNEDIIQIISSDGDMAGKSFEQ